MTASATIVLEQAARERWDAIVIGAGPAGSLAARGLAQRQFHTLLVDRKAFPRSKVCGSCLSRRALSLLDRAGLSEQIAALEGQPLSGVNLLLKSRSLRLSLPGGVAISRADLDEALVKSAIAEGVQFLPQVTATVCPKPEIEELDLRRIELVGSQGDPVNLETSVVIAADGLGHPSLRSCPEFADRIRRNSRMGLAATFASATTGFDFGSVHMAVGKSGYVGAVRLKNGQLHLAASVDQHAMRSGLSPAELVSQILQEARLPAVPEIFEADWQGTLPLTRRSSSVAADRVFLVGDAAGYVEPFTGEGITWALSTGFAVPAFAARVLHQASPQAERDWQLCHRQIIRHRQNCCRGLAWLLRRPGLASAAVGLMSFAPRLPQFLANKLNQPLAPTEWDFA